MKETDHAQDRRRKPKKTKRTWGPQQPKKNTSPLFKKRVRKRRNITPLIVTVTNPFMSHSPTREVFKLRKGSFKEKVSH